MIRLFCMNTFYYIVWWCLGDVGELCYTSELTVVF